jgi:hypothetical protein
LAHLELFRYLPECHVEFILIHPFREGNERLSRLLCDVLSVQAGKDLLDYSLWDKHRAFYFKAIQAVLSGNYSPMMQLVSDILSFGRLKLHYVAMTRPTHLLCLAMRKDAFVDEELSVLANSGWKIIDCGASTVP